MNDVPPSQEPSDDDIDTLYRRASALDPSRPSAGVSRAILAHAALVSAESAPPRDRAGDDARQARTRRTWWRPAVFGTLAAAVLAGLFVLPNIRTSYLAPKTYSRVVRQEAASTPAEPSPSSVQSAPGIAPTSPTAALSSAPASPGEATSARATESFSAATPGQPLATVPTAPPASPAASETAPPRGEAPFARSIARPPAPAPAPPAAPTVRDKRSPTEALASGAAGQLAAPSDAAKAAPRAKASRKPTANEPATNSRPLGGADAKDLQESLVDITVTAQRRTQNDMATSSPISSIAADSLSTPIAAPPDIQFGSPARLHLAAERGDLKTLQAALDQLTDINSRDESGRTALLLATLHKRSKAVTMLLEHGADPNIADANGLTPLQVATKSGKSAIIEALKRAGAH